LPFRVARIKQGKDAAQRGPAQRDLRSHQRFEKEFEKHMNEKNIVKIAAELKLKEKQIRAAAQLLDEGATVPFIARYRKEVTG